MPSSPARSRVVLRIFAILIALGRSLAATPTPPPSVAPEDDAILQLAPPPGLLTTDAEFDPKTLEVIQDRTEDIYSIAEVWTAAPGLRSRLKGYAHPDTEFHMRPVRAIHARAVGDMPQWDYIYTRFVSKYGIEDPDGTGYVAALDTVTTASVEGALMYVQSEAINQFGRLGKGRCRRKNGISYVVFYEMLIAQPNASLAMFTDNTTIPEYGPYVPMEHGRCSPINATQGTPRFPRACLMFNGDDGEPVVGPFVGAEAKPMEGSLAPYPDAYWFSFPNTCPLEPWVTKTPACRAASRRGLCPPGKSPDGVVCTFTYRILGFIPLDDVVGITAMSNNVTGRRYVNFTDFCRYGNIEYSAWAKGEMHRSLPFWAFPMDPTANARRIKQLLDAYGALTTPTNVSTSVHPLLRQRMRALPSVDELAAENPPCYWTVRECAEAPRGCKRVGYAQLCRVCKVQERGCVIAPVTFRFPELENSLHSSANARGGSDRGGDEPQTKSQATSMDSNLVVLLLLLMVSVVVRSEAVLLP